MPALPWSHVASQMNEPPPRAQRDAGESVPFIVRIAGLPSGVMARFASELGATHVRPLRALRDQLQAARSELADAAFRAVTSASPDLRRLLLAVKRDCFNGRVLAPRREAPEWPALRDRVGPVADRAVAAEEELETFIEAFRGAYEAARRREVTALGELADEPGLARGLALASPTLIANRHCLGRGVDAKTEADLEASLLRYVSRVAVKTSPFSTLTRLGFATAIASPGLAPLRWMDGPWQEHSLLRFKRYILEQDYAVLMRSPVLRERSRVMLSNALWEVSPGRYCLVRPGRWTLDDGRMRFSGPSLATVDLSGPLVAWLRSELPGRELTMGGLVAELARAFDTPPERVEASLGKLIDIGLLRRLPPWPTNDTRLENRLLEHLRVLPTEPSLASAIEHLAAIVGEQERYARSPDPLASLRNLERNVQDLWVNTRSIAHIDASVPRYRFPRGGIYEDVFVTAQSRTPWQELMQIPRRAVDDMVASSEPLVRLATLYHPQQEFRHAITAFASRRWPDRREVGVIELIRELQPLWRSYTAFLGQWRTSTARARRRMLFDPLALDTVAELGHVRRSVWTQIVRCARHSDEGEGISIPPGAITNALSGVPERYAPAAGACLMVQPADAIGDQWIVNQIYQGTGRMTSRYTPVIPDRLREQYTAYLAERGALGGVELLDLVFSFGDTLNLHPLQTPKALELPDEWLDVPRNRVRCLEDLAVRFDRDRGPPRVVDRAGQEYSPVHLGGADESFMPAVIRMLAVLGPGELAPVNLPRAAQRHGAARVWPRLRVGNLVLHRRRWAIPIRPFLLTLNRAGDAEAFAAIHDWRSSLAIPDRVFLLEHLGDGTHGTPHKPQYINFTSPCFVRLFLRSLRRAKTDFLRLEEALPDPACALRDGQEKQWVAELQIDTLALNRAAWPDPTRRSSEAVSHEKK